jgi:CheY-like chemotaxis protein
VRGIVLVNVSARSSLAEFRSAGFDAYLVRPVRPASLLMQLKGAVDASTGCGDRADAGERTEDVATLAGQRVLLAEDNEINALLAKRVLERCGCDYVAVPNGAEAVDAIRRSLAGDAPPVDMILMDVFMPELDGVEAAREIKKLYAVTNDARTAPPIIALTANAFAEDKQRYLEAGMDDYLAKPFDRAGLENLLRRWSRRQGGVAA